MALYRSGQLEALNTYGIKLAAVPPAVIRQLRALAQQVTDHSALGQRLFQEQAMQNSKMLHPEQIGKFWKAHNAQLQPVVEQLKTLSKQYPLQGKQFIPNAAGRVVLKKIR
jgi:hypothetical protein